MSAEEVSSDLSEVLTTLFGQSVAVNHEGEAEAPVGGLASVFLTGEGKPVGVLSADYEAANFLGAGLTRIPSSQAEENAENGEIPDIVEQNLQEVFNVCTRFFMQPQYETVRLEDTIVIESTGALPEEFDTAVNRAGTKAIYTVDIPNYGRGKIRLFTS